MNISDELWNMWIGYVSAQPPVQILNRMMEEQNASQIKETEEADVRGEAQPEGEKTNGDKQGSRV